MSQINRQAKNFFYHCMNRVKCLSSFETEFFVFPMSIGQSDDNHVSEIEWKSYSGNRNGNISYVNRGRDPILFVCYDEKVSL